MNIDKLKQYVSLRSALQKEKTLLEDRLQKINGALGVSGSVAPALAPTKARAVTPEKNPFSLKQAVIRVLAAKPLTRKEILSATQDLGYRFTAKNPMSSLNAVLYGKQPKFKRQGGKFSLGAPQPNAAKQNPGEPKPAGGWTLSPATRAKLSARATARWAQIKKAGGKSLQKK